MSGFWRVLRWCGPVALVVLLAVANGGCGISSPSSNREETLSNSVNIGQVVTHTFSIGKTGEFNVKITALAPDADAVLGIAWGQPSGGSCAIFVGYTNTFSTLNRTALSGPITQTGSYCVQVYDSGLLKRSENYTVVVSHP